MLGNVDNFAPHEQFRVSQECCLLRFIIPFNTQYIKVKHCYLMAPFFTYAFCMIFLIIMVFSPLFFFLSLFPFLRFFPWFNFFSCSLFPTVNLHFIFLTLYNWKFEDFLSLVVASIILQWYFWQLPVSVDTWHYCFGFDWMQCKVVVSPCFLVLFFLCSHNKMSAHT